MDEKDHLAPPHIYQRSDEESISTYTKLPKTTSKIPVYALLSVVILSIIFLIIGLFILRIEAPSIMLSKISITDLQYQSPPPNLASINMTVNSQIRVKNDNFGRFRFEKGESVLMYGNSTFGRVDLSSGRVGARGEESMNVTVSVVQVDYNSSGNYMNFSRDVDLGLVQFWSYASLRGKVRVTEVATRWRTAVMNCSVAVNLTSQQVQNWFC